MVYKVTSFEELRERVSYIVEGNDEMKERREKYIEDNFYLPTEQIKKKKKVVRYIEEN